MRPCMSFLYDILLVNDLEEDMYVLTVFVHDHPDIFMDDRMGITISST